MRTKYLLLPILIFFTNGCSNSHLAYVHEATLGLSLAPVNPQSGSAKFSFGYDRETYALIPRTGPGEEAMSLAAVSRVYSQGVNKVQFGHVVATGEAAVEIANNPEALNKAKQNLDKTAQNKTEGTQQKEEEGGGAL